MIKNYRKHFIKNPPKFKLTPDYVEQVEVESLGGIHSRIGSGPDGWWSDGDIIEIKTQIFNPYSQGKNGPVQLMGKATYSNPSILVHGEKLKKDEYTLVVGADIDGEAYFRYSYRFSAIEVDYLNRVNYLLSIGRTHGNNYVLIPCEYFKDKERGNEKFQSFQMHFIHEDIKNMAFTENGIQRIQAKWFNFLWNFNNCE